MITFKYCTNCKAHNKSEQTIRPSSYALLLGIAHNFMPPGLAPQLTETGHAQKQL